MTVSLAMSSQLRGRFHTGSGVGRRASLLVVLVVALVVTNCGCGGGVRVLSSTEAKHLLLQLPYRYRWRQVELPEGASGALAGTAFGKHHTIVHFGISLGAEPQAVPVPRAGVLTPDYEWGNGFVFNDDMVLPKGIGRQFHTTAQWHEAAKMVVDMEEKLCKAATAKPCPV